MYDAGTQMEPGHGGQVAEPLAPVLVTFPEPAPQNRVTVLVRLFLVIPHVVCLWLLGVAAEVVAVIGWFGALFTGRLPQFAADFLGGVLQWQVRVYAYAALLTDQYPPFTLGDAPYPVQLAYRPGQLNRLAVLFRIFLLIPAGVVAEVLAVGAWLASIVGWLITLFSGKLPTAMHQALAATVRYLARYYGYIFMLTSTYPGGVFGDQPVEADPGFAGASAGFASPEAEPGSAESEGQPGFATTPEEEPSFAAAESEPSFAAAEGEPSFAAAGGPAGFAAPPPPADPWRLVLSSQARTLVGVFLGVGVLGLAGGVSGELAVANSSVSTIHQVNDTYHSLAQQLLSEQSALSACGNTNASCIAGTFTRVASSYDGFVSDLAGESMPTSSAASAQAAVLTDARKLASDYRQLGTGTSISQLNSLLTSLGVQGDEEKFSTDSNALGTSLGANVTGR